MTKHETRITLLKELKEITKTDQREQTSSNVHVIEGKVEHRREYAYDWFLGQDIKAILRHWLYRINRKRVHPRNANMVEISNEKNKLKSTSNKKLWKEYTSCTRHTEKHQ